MKNKTIGKKPVVLIIAVVTVVMLISATTAWIILNESHTFSRLFSISNFSASAEIYFLHNGSMVGVGSFTDVNDGTINVNVTDSTQPNYIGNLRLDLKYKGKGTALIRVKSVHQFMNQDGQNNDVVIPMNAQVPYTLNGAYSGQDYGNCLKWYDNRANDYCLYLATPIYSSDNSTVRTLNVISGIDPGFSVPSGTTLKVAFELQAVQVNRFKQFWGIDTLPWNGADVKSNTDSHNIDIELTTGI